MTRLEAIENIAAEFSAAANEYCVGEAEQDENTRKLRDSLRALGVADVEMPEHVLNLPADGVIDAASQANAEHWTRRYRELGAKWANT